METSSYVKSIPSETSKLATEDDLLLSKIKAPNLTTEIMFPEELNRYLKQHIKSLEQNLAINEEVLQEKDGRLEAHEKKIEALEKKIKQYEHLNSLSSNSKFQTSHTNVAASKIVELSKKVRDLTSEMETYRTKCAGLENQVRQLTSDPEKLDIVEPDKDLKLDKTDSEKLDQVKILSDKVATLTKKLFDQKNQNSTLSHDLKQANKLLSQEIGESFTGIYNLANTSSNWRGRAQQIINLQEKLTEVQEKLSNSSGIKGPVNNDLTLRQIESNKRQAYEDSIKELTQTKHTLEETTKKLHGSRARSKVLENELSTIKMKINAFVDKSQHDDQLISALTGNVKVVENKWKEKIASLEKQQERNESEILDLRVQLEKELDKRSCFQKSLAEKESKIEDLRAQLQNIKGLKPLQASVKLDEGDRKLEIGFKIDKTNNQAANAERMRLLDLIGQLNIRIDKAHSKFTDTQILLKKEQQKVHQLEAKITKMELEKCAQRTYTRNSLKANSQVLDKPEAHEELKYKLELSEEKILLLESRVDTLKKEKQMDLDNFSLTMEQTKQVYDEALQKALMDEANRN